MIGGGAWGTALALTLHRGGHNPLLYVRTPEEAAALEEEQEHKRALPGIRFDAPITVTAEREMLRSCDLLLLATPAQSLRNVAQMLGPVISPKATLILCAKGLDQETGSLLSQLCKKLFPENSLAVLSGPSFAHDVARGLPTAVTLAAPLDTRALQLAEILASPTFRVYSSTDMIGVQIGGALKNVLAIACGFVEGRGLGASARAALTARAFAEMQRFGLALGAKKETLTGLSGLGDLVLSCSSTQSRNFSLGVKLGQGIPLGELLVPGMDLVEGIATAPVAQELGRRYGLDLPIITAVSDLLAERQSSATVVETLLSRPLRAELDDNDNW